MAVSFSNLTIELSPCLGLQSWVYGENRKRLSLLVKPGLLNLPILFMGKTVFTAELKSTNSILIFKSEDCKD